MEQLLQLERTQNEVLESLNNPRGLRPENVRELLDTRDSLAAEIETFRKIDEIEQRLGQAALFPLQHEMLRGASRIESDEPEPGLDQETPGQGQLLLDTTNEGARYV